MAPVYPLGVNVLVARVGGAVYAVSGQPVICLSPADSTDHHRPRHWPC
jgi:hypothetical protein